MRIERLYRRERMWERIAIWARRNYQATVARRKLAQREAYLRKQALERAKLFQYVSVRPADPVMTEEEEDEFFG